MYNQIAIVGLDEPMFHYTEQCNKSKAVVQEKLQEIAFIHSMDGVKILLAHHPEWIEHYADKKYDLVFAGHAHGGQMRLPFIGGILAPFQGFFPKYTAGKYTVGNTQMIVSRGLGNSFFPFRFNNYPDIVLATLHASNKSE